MRDLLAGLLAAALLLAAGRLATTLHQYQRRRRRARESERALGRTILVEIPADPDFLLVSEDAARFYYGERTIDKDLITAVRVLINGAPIAAYESTRSTRRGSPSPTTLEDRPEGIARDRWDVAIESVNGTTVVECGAIRERVSQELARTVFDAVRRELQRRDEATEARSRD